MPAFRLASRPLHLSARPAGPRPARPTTLPIRAGEGGCGCGSSAPSGGCGDKASAAAGAAQPAVAAEPTTAAALTAFAAALGNSDGTVPRSAMDAIAAPLRRSAAAVAEGEAATATAPPSTERVVTIAELLAFDPDDPDNDLDKYIV